MPSIDAYFSLPSAIFTLLTESQLLNILTKGSLSSIAIDVNVEGRLTVLMLPPQYINNFTPIVSTPSSKVAVSSPVQEANTSSPKVLTLPGTVTSVSPVQSAKALSPIADT